MHISRLTTAGWLLVVLALAAPWSCTRVNPAYCDEETVCPYGNACDLASRSCVPDAEFGMCEVSTECNRLTPVCDLLEGQCRPCEPRGERAEECRASLEGPFCSITGECVACLEPSHCDGDRPICDGGRCTVCDSDAQCLDRDPATPWCTPEGGCVACLRDEDCASEVCDLAQSQCVDAEAVLYVGGVGAGPSDGSLRCGTRAMPCDTIAGGLEELGDRLIVRIRPGSYVENLQVAARALTLVGGGATIVSLDGSAPVLDISGGAEVTARNLEIHGTSTGDSVGVACGGSASTLSLAGVRITGMAGAAIWSAGCDLDVARSEIVGNLGTGLRVLGGRLVLERSRIVGNAGGGLHLQSADFRCLNNYWIANGAATSAVGGVRIDNFGSAGEQIFAYNTVVASVSAPAAPSSGVHCESDAAILSSTIVRGGIGAEAAVSGSCPWRYSDIEGGVESALDAGYNVTGDPLFVDPAKMDYRITASSSCRNVAEKLEWTEVDYDGELRGVDGGHDIGADEVM